MALLVASRLGDLGSWGLTRNDYYYYGTIFLFLSKITLA